jgi:hypothetical protein
VTQEFQRLGWEAEDAKLVAAVDSEIDRLEHEAATLQKMRAELFGGCSPFLRRATVQLTLISEPYQSRRGSSAGLT